MLEANKCAFFEKIFSVYNRNLLKRRFHSLNVSGLDFLFNKNPSIPLIIYCNHSSWWDGLVAFQISFQAKLNSFVMMEEKQLKELFLFRKLGAFSVVRDNPRKAYQSIKYAARILNNDSASVLWIFPQGEILPNDLRPLRFYKGLTKIVELTRECAAASLAMRYEFLGDYKPRIFVKIEKPENFSSREISHAKQLSEILSEKLTENLDGLKNDVLHNKTEGYQSIL
jgi:chlorobactene lauroyltransferase